MRHQHAEAFCLMTYRADDGETEVIWNSRDGVTPFVITLRSGKQAKHVDWQNDAYAPNHKPKRGERIFADLTPERARAHAVRMVNLHPQHIPPGMTGNEMVEKILTDMRPDAPDLIEVK